ncbi:LPXTG cell wall anchor domain-containing protein, partial [Levilactobacillus spicheri]
VAQGGQNGTGTTPPRQATAEGHGGQGASQQGYSAISRLPQTSEQQRVSAFVLGILILGGALSYQAWRRRE